MLLHRQILQMWNLNCFKKIVFDDRGERKLDVYIHRWVFTFLHTIQYQLVLNINIRIFTNIIWNHYMSGSVSTKKKTFLKIKSYFSIIYYKFRCVGVWFDNDWLCNVFSRTLLLSKMFYMIHFYCFTIRHLLLSSDITGFWLLLAI